MLKHCYFKLGVSKFATGEERGLAFYKYANSHIYPKAKQQRGKAKNIMLPLIIPVPQRVAGTVGSMTQAVLVGVTGPQGCVQPCI